MKMYLEVWYWKLKLVNITQNEIILYCFVIYQLATVKLIQKFLIQNEIRYVDMNIYIYIYI